MRPLARRSTLPVPIVVAPAQSFDGFDGNWSTYAVDVGTPPQKFYVLPGTQVSETWVILPDGCEAPPTDPANCETLRGAQAFNGQPPSGFLTNASSTWAEAGLFEIKLEENLGIDGVNGLFGDDVVGVNNGNGSANGVSLAGQPVAGIAAKSFFLGYLGLGITSPSFSSSAKPQNTFLSNLWMNNLIPSLSYGYTAGASYGDNGKYNWGSMVLGGYDNTKLDTTKRLSVPFSGSDSRALTVGVQSIIATNTLNGTVSMTSGVGGHISLVDSTVSELWLPGAVCDSFASALGLFYDNNTGYYLVTDATRAKWLAQNPSFTFKLGQNSYDNGVSTNIILPYAAFDHQLGWPIYSTRTNYFPIRRAANDSQYTLGRTFLQEAYIIVDYEAKNFTLAPAAFPDTTTNQVIVPVASVAKPTVSKAALSAGPIAGIVVGGIVLLAALAALFVFLRRRRSARLADAKLAELANTEATPHDAKHHPGGAGDGALFEADGGLGAPPSELPGSAVAGGMYGKGGGLAARSELESPAPVFEMEGDSEMGGSSTAAHSRSASTAAGTLMTPASGSVGSPNPLYASPSQPSPLSR